MQKKLLKTKNLKLILRKKDTDIAEELDDPIEKELRSRKGGLLEKRPPLVTIIGHVDHGKTTLLDTLRGSNIVDKEAGKITQHVGAYTIKHNKEEITFLDTPGHEAFSAMRKRGVNVTDIVLLVISADDKVNQQTKEGINLIIKNKLNAIIVINKIDLPNADPEKIMQELQTNGILVEDWGGNYGCVQISAKNKTGLDKLLERIILEAEMLELKAAPKGVGEAVVIESQIDQTLGPTSNIIIKNGILKISDYVICGEFHGRIKALINDKGEKFKQVHPGHAVKISGLTGSPSIGSILLVCKDKKEGEKLSKERQEVTRRKKLSNVKKATSLNEILEQLNQEKKEALNLIIKADVQGSLEVILQELNKIPTEKVTLNIIRAEIGSVNNKDIDFASSSKAEIVGFHVRVNTGVNKLAKANNVNIKLYSVIYDLTEKIYELMTGLVKSKFLEKKLGTAKILKIFKIKGNKICGSLVTSGNVVAKAYARVIRDREEIYNGSIKSLRRFKDNVKEVSNGLECGIDLDNFNDFETEDIIEVYQVEEIKGDL